MQIQNASRLDHVPPYPFAEIERRVREITSNGHDVIRLDMGSPDLPPPDEVIEHLYESSKVLTAHGYGGFTGSPTLRKAFVNYYARRFEVELDPDSQVLPLLGSKEGIVNIALALVNPGEVVLVPDLAYTAYAAGAYLAGAQPVEYHLSPENSYLPDLESIPLDSLGRAKMMWINYPHNPTGAVATLDDLKKIVQFCRENGILLCSDNPYSDIAFDGKRPPSVLEVDGSGDLAVEFNSLSKTYNMAGWRIGVCVGNRKMVKSLLTVKSNIDSGMFKPMQEAATYALNNVTTDWVAARNKVYEQRRDIVLRGLSEAGLEAERPSAGIYVWARLKSGDSKSYVAEALEQAHVSLTPGNVYGTSGAGFVRFSLVTGEDRIADAMARLGAWQSGA